MATGALDANGIWQYGEDDSEPTFSGMLNKLASSTSTTVTRLEELSGLTAAQLTTHRDNLGVGLVNVVPTSVAQAGGSASANAQGLVTFTGVTSLSLNDVFTATYTNYRVIIKQSQSAQGDLSMRLRTTSDVSTAIYYLGGIAAPASGAIQAYQGNGITYWAVGSANSTTPGSSSVDIYAPNLAEQTRGSFTASGNNASFFTGYCGGIYTTVTTQFTGFTIFNQGGGTVSGTVQVFGYNI